MSVTPWEPAKQKRLLGFHNDGLSITQIAGKMGGHTQTIRNQLAALGIKVKPARQRPELAKPRNIKPTLVVDNVVIEVAELRDPDAVLRRFSWSDMSAAEIARGELCRRQG